MKKTKALEELKAATLAVYMYDTMYQDWMPLPVVKFIEEAQEKWGKAYWIALDNCTLNEMKCAINAVLPGLADNYI